jgi:hypothetical protein
MYASNNRETNNRSEAKNSRDANNSSAAYNSRDARTAGGKAATAETQHIAGYPERKKKQR